MIDAATKLLGLLGSPIRHTLSPRIHNHALRELRENLVYVALEIAAEDLGDLIRLFPRIGGVGLNITTPYKAEVGRIVRAGEEEVARTGIVNTVVYRDGNAVGHATDGRGFHAWLEANRIEPAEGGIVLLGFGATARSIAHHLGAVHPLTIVSRNPDEAEAILKRWYAHGWRGLPARGISWSDPVPPSAALVVSGLPGEFARSERVATWLSEVDAAAVIVDLNYGAGRTPLRDQARDRGLTAFDGTGLLVHQAALSLSLWLEREVPAALLERGLGEIG